MKYVGFAIAILVFVSPYAAERGGEHEELAQQLDEITSRNIGSDDAQELAQLNADLAAFIDRTVRQATKGHAAQLRLHAALVEGMQLPPPPYMCRILCQATCGYGFSRVQAEAATTLKACKDYVNDGFDCGALGIGCNVRLAKALGYCADQFAENQAAGAVAFGGCSGCCGTLSEGQAYHHCDDVFMGVAIDTSLPEL